MSGIHPRRDVIGDHRAMKAWRAALMIVGSVLFGTFLVWAIVVDRTYRSLDDPPVGLARRGRRREGGFRSDFRRYIESGNCQGCH